VAAASWRSVVAAASWRSVVAAASWRSVVKALFHGVFHQAAAQ
jgi:hypothetical protein